MIDRYTCSTNGPPVKVRRSRKLSIQNLPILKAKAREGMKTLSEV